MSNSPTHPCALQTLRGALAALGEFLNSSILAYCPIIGAKPPDHTVNPRAAHRTAVAGDSVGGNMATVVSLLAKERSGPAIAAQLLFYPVTNADFETGSYKQFADGPWLTRAAMQWFWDQYLPDHNQRKDATASPLLASLKQLADLPRALIITAENDVLRDEGEAYGRKLIEAGVEVVTTRYNATIHDFVMLNALAGAAPTRAAVSQGIDFLKSVFAPKR
jgi:acetyl esterase/lipase